MPTILERLTTNFTVFRGKRTREDRDRAVPPDAMRALLALRTMSQNYDTLRRAIFVAIAAEETLEGEIRAFCEDFGVDQIDAVKRIDVLRWALKACGELKDG